MEKTNNLMNPKIAYEESTYLIYSCFEAAISGSLLIDSARTIDEAESKITIYKERHETSVKNNPALYRPTKTRFCYIENKASYWVY